MIATKPRKKRDYQADIDIVAELIEHLTSRTENHRMPADDLIPADGRVTRQQLLRIHAKQHEKDLEEDYIVAHIRMFECTQA